jgi:hypothetical protein
METVNVVIMHYIVPSKVIMLEPHSTEKVETLNASRCQYIRGLMHMQRLESKNPCRMCSTGLLSSQTADSRDEMILKVDSA